MVGITDMGALQMTNETTEAGENARRESPQGERVEDRTPEAPRIPSQQDRERASPVERGKTAVSHGEDSRTEKAEQQDLGPQADGAGQELERGH